MQPHMTFSDEPGKIYIRGEVRDPIGRHMHITENGPELSTPQSPPSLENPFEKDNGRSALRGTRELDLGIT